MKLGDRLKTLIVRTGQAIGTLVALVVTFVAAALIAFVPLTALPGDFQTDFVNGSWVLPIWIGILVLVFSLRLGPLAQQKSDPWWPSTLRSMWRLLSTFVAFFWLAGALAWLNAFDVQESRAHDMLVVGYVERAARAGGSTVKHYKLVEEDTSWRADLQSTHSRDAFLKVGACVRIAVRPGRLGLDWISDAQPIKCRK